jgi:hypothetical protein
MTLYLLKVHLQMFLSISITQKCQILSCDTPVANERYSMVVNCILIFNFSHSRFFSLPLSYSILWY